MNLLQSIEGRRLIVFAFPLLLSLPFLGRAYFVDDSYFVEIASWLRHHPAQPYDFTADDAGLQNHGWEKDGFVRMVNPLAHHYYLALLIAIGGANEWFLRFGCVLLSCVSALFIFEFARRWTEHALLSTLLLLATPAHWLTAHSLLIDSTMSFFFMGAFYYFMRATERESLTALVASGLFMGMAILSKYTAVFIIPLTFVWWTFRRKKLTRPFLFVIPWLIAFSFLAFYSVVTWRLYGRPHIIAASARMVHVFGYAKVLSLLVFFSGATLVPLLAWAALDARAMLKTSLAVFILAQVLASKVGGFDGVQASMMALWFVTSAVSVWVFWTNRADWVFPRDNFIFVWVVGFLAMMLVVMDWVAARYYLIALPGAVFMAVRITEMRWRQNASRILNVTLAVVLCVSASMAYADYEQAEPSRRVGAQLRARGISGGPRHFFLGDSFTMSYLKEEGWTACFPSTKFQVGDMILAKEITMPQVWFAKRPISLREVARFDYPTHFPIKVMDYYGSAGFYASVWGALPFTFSSSPWERFHVFEVVEVHG